MSHWRSGQTHRTLNPKNTGSNPVWLTLQELHPRRMEVQRPRGSRIVARVDAEVVCVNIQIRGGVGTVAARWCMKQDSTLILEP